jgi:hypothetical protein
LRVEARKFHRRPVVAWLAGPLVVALGVSAHSISGESVPAASILVALTALVSMSASMVAYLRLPGWVLLLLSGLAQQVLHIAFGLFSGVVGGDSPGHGHGILPWQPPLPSSASSPPAHAMGLMLHAHVAAALLAALVIIEWDSVIFRIRSVRQRGFTDGLPHVTGSSFGSGE